MRAILILALLLPGCATDTSDVGGAPPPPLFACGADPASGFYADNFYFIEFDTSIFRQGATVRITPRANNAPAGNRELPLDCTSGWKVTGPARLSADRRSLVIAPDAPRGAKVGISFRYGSEEAGSSFEVIGRDDVVLTGRRTQQSVENCPGAERVGELEFSPGNRFSVTYQPFETYKDYWGTYSFDPSSGRLAMSIEGGNFQPPDVDLEGTARLGSDGRLVLDGFYLGGRRGTSLSPQNCRYIF